MESLTAAPHFVGCQVHGVFFVVDADGDAVALNAETWQPPYFGAKLHQLCLQRDRLAFMPGVVSGAVSNGKCEVDIANCLREDNGGDVGQGKVLVVVSCAAKDDFIDGQMFEVPGFDECLGERESCPKLLFVKMTAEA